MNIYIRVCVFVCVVNTTGDIMGYSPPKPMFLHPLHPPRGCRGAAALNGTTGTYTLNNVETHLFNTRGKKAAKCVCVCFVNICLLLYNMCWWGQSFKPSIFSFLSFFLVVSLSYFLIVFNMDPLQSAALAAMVATNYNKGIILQWSSSEESQMQA